MKDAVDTKANADMIAQIFNMNITGAELIGLIHEEIENLIGGDGIEGFTDGINGVGVASSGNANVIIMNNFGRVVTEHEDLERRKGDEEEGDALTAVVIFLTKRVDGTARSLTSDHELKRFFSAAIL